MNTVTKKQILLIDRFLAKLLKLYKYEYMAALGEIKGMVLDVYQQITVEEKPLLSHLYQFRRYYKLTKDIQKVLTQLGVKHERIFSKEIENYFKDNVELLDDQFAVPFETKEKELRKRLNYLIEDTQWSDSIWRDKAQLLQKVRHELVMNVAMGKSIDDMAKQLEPEQLTTNFYNAKRLIRTEIARYYRLTTTERYKNVGITKVKWKEVMDNRTCEECKKHHNEIMDINKVPPTGWHPQCRGWVEPIIE